MHPFEESPGGLALGARRSQLIDRYQKRRHRLYNLWYQYSPKLDRDVVLSSDAAFDHFCWLEGDTNVKAYTLEPEPLRLCIDDQIVSTQFDVCVEVRTGRSQVRDVDSRSYGDPESTDPVHKRQLAAQAGFDYMRVDLVVLRQHRQLIVNWRRAISFIAAARDCALHEFHHEIALVIRHEPSTTIAGLLLNADQEAQPLLLAALFRALQEGWLRSNLDEAPLSPATRIYREQGAV